MWQRVDILWRSVLPVGICSTFVVRGFDVALARHWSFYPLSFGSSPMVGGTSLGVRLLRLSSRPLVIVVCVFHLFAFVFRSSFPDVLSRSGFDKKLLLMSPLRCESCFWQAATCSRLPRTS